MNPVLRNIFHQGLTLQLWPSDARHFHKNTITIGTFWCGAFSDLSDLRNHLFQAGNSNGQIRLIMSNFVEYCAFNMNNSDQYFQHALIMLTYALAWHVMHQVWKMLIHSLHCGFCSYMLFLCCRSLRVCVSGMVISIYKSCVINFAMLRYLSISKVDSIETYKHAPATWSVVNSIYSHMLQNELNKIFYSICFQMKLRYQQVD